MASMTFVSTLARLQATSRSAIIVHNPWSSINSFRTSPAGSFQVNRRYCGMATRDEIHQAAKQGRDAANRGVDAAKKSSHQLKNEAMNATDNIAQKTKDVAGKVSNTAHDAAEKVKQTAQEAWGSVKDTSQKIKDTVVDKAEASVESARETIKDEATVVERCMNSKDLTP